jgi:hypothetical protein
MQENDLHENTWLNVPALHSLDNVVILDDHWARTAKEHRCLFFMPLHLPVWIERLERALAAEESSGKTGDWYWLPREALALNGTRSAWATRGSALSLYEYQPVVVPHLHDSNKYRCYGLETIREACQQLRTVFDENAPTRGVHKLSGGGVPLQYEPPLPVMHLALSPIKTAAVLAERLDEWRRQKRLLEDWARDVEEAKEWGHDAPPEPRVDAETLEWREHALYFLSLAGTQSTTAWRELERPAGLRSPPPLPAGDVVITARRRIYTPPRLHTRSDSQDSQATVTDELTAVLAGASATTSTASSSRDTTSLSFQNLSLAALTAEERFDLGSAARRAGQQNDGA